MIGKRYVFSAVLMSMLMGCGGEEGDAPEGAAGPEGVSAGGRIDACKIVTQDDATRLFGQPASPYTGTPVLDSNMIGECLWAWDSETSSHLLQFHVWNGEQYYSAMPDSEPVDFAEKGFIRTHRMAGVDIGWIQDGKTISLNYGTFGPDVPKAMTKADQMKQLASRSRRDCKRLPV